MALKLYNTLTRQKTEFVPIDPSNVRMYVCGPTVYDYAHIGNARPVIVFDVLFRLLRHIYGPDHVTYVRNITDVDDKINARAARDYPGLPLNEAIRKVTETTEKQFHTDIAALGVLQPTYEPRATEFIRRQDGREDMVSLIDTLVKRGHAYVAENHVLFDVESMPDYGRLSNRTLEEMEAGARVEVAPYKKGPMDFVLWKPSKPGEPAWPSPSGIQAPGRPGWHIECSAMAGALLGPVFDIHGGGIDLTFPHHENEIAQSRCAHGTAAMANVWMHNGFLQVEGEKMSKSLGNFVTIHELLSTRKFGGRIWPGEVLRWAMLMTHYREPINWSVERLTEARNELANWSEAVLEGSYPVDVSGVSPSDAVLRALEDDLNTPLARTHLQSLYKKAVDNDENAMRVFCRTLEWLGIFRPHFQPAYGVSALEGEGTEIMYLSKYKDVALDARAVVLNKYRWATASAEERETSRARVELEINALDAGMEQDGVAFRLGEHCDLWLVSLDEKGRANDLVKQMIAARLEARKRKDFAESDRIRDELAGMGIALKDTKNKETGEIETTWEIAR